MPFVGAVAFDGHDAGLRSEVVGRSFAALHSGRFQRAAEGGCAVLAVIDRFLEGLPGDCLYRHPETGLIAAADARIDNADDLKALLPAGAALSPAALIAGAYLASGDAFAERLRGDYAAALWDPRSHRLLLLSDRADTRSLLFLPVPGGVVFATELSVLLADAAAPRTLDPRHLARWLEQHDEAESELVFPGVYRVLPGHLAVIGPDGVRQRRYWHPEHAPDIRFRRTEEYVEATESLIEQAVRCRLPRRLAAGCHLSGGLDSPLVAGTAARLLERQGRRLLTFTKAHTDPEVGRLWDGAYWDEHRAALAFAGGFPNIDSVTIPYASGTRFVEVLDTVIAATGFPAALSLFRSATDHELALAARNRGVGVLLTGIAGNHTVSQDGASLLSELLARGRWRELAAQGLALRRNGFGVKGMAWITFGPFLPGWAQRRLLAWKGAAPLPRAFRSPLAPEILAERDVRDRLRRIDRNWTPDFTPREQAAMLARTCMSVDTSWFRLGYGIDLRSPLLDSRVVEFCAGLPPDQFLGKGETRLLARRLLRRMGAPETLVGERRQGVQIASWHAQMTAAAPAIRAELEALENSPTASHVLDLPGLRRALDELPGVDPRRRENMVRYMSRTGIALGVGRLIQRMEGGNRGPAMGGEE